MTASILYRALRADDVSSLADIDRSERIDGTYRVADGRLVFDAGPRSFPTWPAEERAGYEARLRAVLEANGFVLGAWDRRRLAGIGTLDPRGVGGDRRVMQLDMLYVSAPQRGRGIGRTLTERVAARARALGAHALAISATPTKATVDAYLRLGARLDPAPDPELVAREPDDVQMRLDLT